MEKIYTVMSSTSTNSGITTKYVSTKNKVIKYLEKMSGVSWKDFLLSDYSKFMQEEFTERPKQKKDIWQYDIRNLCSYPCSIWHYKLVGKKHTYLVTVYEEELS